MSLDVAIVESVVRLPFTVSGAGKVYEPALNVGMDEFNANTVTHLESLKAEREPAFSRRLIEPDPSAFFRCPGDDGVKLLSNPAGQQQRGGGLVDPALNLGGGILLIRAMLGEFCQLRVGVGQRRSASRCCS